MRTRLGFWKQRRREDDLDQEIDSYLEIVAGEKMAAGVDPEQAMRLARLELGGKEPVKEAVREIWTGAWLGQVGTDFRYAVRSLSRSPAFVAAAILSLALGVAVNGVAFSNVRFLVQHPFPYPDLDRIMTVWETAQKAEQREPVAPGNFLDWKEANHSFESLAAYRPWSVTMTRSGEPERIQAQLVTADFFRVVGVSAERGRTFRSDETEPGRDDKAILSHRFWKVRLGAPANIVGQTIVLGARSYLVTGVLGQDDEYPLETDVWVPMALSNEEKTDRLSRSLLVIGRLRPGVSESAGLHDLQAIASRLETRYPLSNRGRTAQLAPLAAATAAQGVTTRFVTVLFAGAFFVMLLACANCANLLLARAVARQKELGIRAALGANRWRIARQILVEIGLLGTAAAGTGLLLGAWDLDQIKRGVPAEALRYVPGIQSMHMDGASIVFTVALSLASGFACGIPTFVRLFGSGGFLRVLGALNQTGRASHSNASSTGWRSGIVVLESALALLLLVGAGLMASTFHNMLTFDRGFDSSHLLRMETSLPEARYASPAGVRSFVTSSLERLSNLPGSPREVDSVAASASLGSGLIRVENRQDPLPGEPEAQFLAVTPAYWKTLRIPLLAGRWLAPSDGADTAPAVMVSQALAKQYWPGGSPVGQRVRVGKDPRWFSVAGVCGDIKDWFTGNRELTVYGALAQTPGPDLTFLARTAGDPARITSEARRQISAVDPNQPVFKIGSMDHFLAIETSGVRAAARMMEIYALIALLLALTGIYSLSSYVATQRTQEMGLRMALGANPHDILRLAIAQSWRLSGLGVGIGLAAAIALARVMSSVLMNVVSLDWKIFGGLALLLLAAALVAAYVPANRASRVDPAVALRHD